MSKFAAVIKSAKKGDTQKVIQILQEDKLNVNELDGKSGLGLLHIAIQNQDEELFEAISSQPGADLQLLSKQDETPLDYSVRLNNIWVVNKLLQNNINIKRKNNQGETILHTAIRCQASREILKKLTINKFDINEPISKYGNYFNLVIEEGDSDAFYFFIQELPIDYSRKFDDDGNSCLMIAVRRNKGDYVMAILNKVKEDPLLTQLDRQFFVNHQNNYGNTALHQAALKNMQTINQLLEKYGKEVGIDLTLRNKKGKTVSDIRSNRDEERQLEMQMQKKKQEQKVIRKHQKNQQKKRQMQEEERLRIEQNKRKKQEQKVLKIEAKVKAETQKKKTIWIIFILLAIALGAMYLSFINAIEKKKPVTL